MPTPVSPTSLHMSDAFSPWDDALKFELFSERPQPTLSVPEQIAAELAQRILAGKPGPGERIAEQQVADEFKVSRGPVREAIRLLEREGLATVLPRRGAVVTELSAHEVAELFEIRTALFALVVQKIAAALPPDLEVALESGIRRLEALATLPDGGSAYAETVYKLLIVVARSCDNLRLQQMLGALSLQTLRYSKLGLASVERRQKSVQLWRDTLDALRRGNVELAVKLSQQRIIESGAEALRSLA
jgi:DNA-binding GntR family transcriptional regulator